MAAHDQQFLACMHAGSSFLLEPYMPPLAFSSMYSSTPSPACICCGSHPSDEQIVGMYFARSQSFRMEDSIAAGRHPILNGQLTSLWSYPTTRLGNPKVAQHQPAVSQQENVLRLEVPVENQAAVHVVQA